MKSCKNLIVCQVVTGLLIVCRLSWNLTLCQCCIVVYMQASQRQLVLDYDKKLAAATEAERAIGRAMTTQVESLQRQVASLTSLQAENEALKAAVEVCVIPSRTCLVVCSFPHVLNFSAEDWECPSSCDRSCS